jgi:hypothetical protein
MECHEVQPLLIDFADNKLHGALAEEINRHLMSCDPCRSELEEIRSLFHTINDVPVEQPDGSLRENFEHMLQSELNRLAAANTVIAKATSPAKQVNWQSLLLRAAAVVILLGGGILVGLTLKNSNEPVPTKQIAELQTEVKDMKEILMFNLLKEESPSERIKAVSYSEEIVHPNQKVIGALFNLLDHDKNVNVRLASAYSLVRFSDNKSVMDSLVASLGRQTEPIIQIVLINILTEKKESKAIKPIQEIISNGNTMKEVKDIAEKSLKLL